MIQQLGEKWPYFWRRTNRLLLAMDVDPLEDIHRRLQRLEAANLTPKVSRHCAPPPARLEKVAGGGNAVGRWSAGVLRFDSPPSLRSAFYRADTMFRAAVSPADA
jgi:hypothetical protein